MACDVCPSGGFARIPRRVPAPRAPSASWLFGQASAPSGTLSAVAVIMANNPNTQQQKDGRKGSVDPRTGSNEHNQKEHEERLARESERVKPGQPGFNEHNAQEHEEKLRREGQS